MEEAEVSGENRVHGKYLNIIQSFGWKPECKRLIGRTKRRYEKNMPSLNEMVV